MIIIYNMEVERVKELYKITDDDVINILKKYESYSDENYKNNIVLY